MDDAKLHISDALSKKYPQSKEASCVVMLLTFRNDFNFVFILKILFFLIHLLVIEKLKLLVTYLAVMELLMRPKEKQKRNESNLKNDFNVMQSC